MVPIGPLHGGGVLSAGKQARLTGLVTWMGRSPRASTPLRQARDAERLIAGVILWPVAGNALVEPFAVASQWNTNRHPQVMLLLPLVGMAYTAWLVMAARPRQAEAQIAFLGVRPVDLVLAILACTAGALGELVAEPSATSSGMANAGYCSLAIAAYAGAARLPRWWSAGVVAVAATHLLALHDRPTAGVQGAVLLCVIWAATSWVARELRRAGLDADQACAAARGAEREEAYARVHDALGLMRVFSRHDAPRHGLAAAAEATTRRTDAWIFGTSQTDRVAAEIAQVAAQFPDLRLRLDLGELSATSDGETLAALRRAVHTLLGNVREHAHATQVTVRGADTARGWVVTIADDGHGFDVADTAPRLGLGLTCFTRDGLARVAVAMTVDSSVGDGTTVTLRGERVGRARGGTPPASAATGSRFAACRRRPGCGRARAVWVTDLSRGLLVATLWLMIASGAGDLVERSKLPWLALGLVVAAAATLTVSWLVAACPSAPTALACSAVGTACGAVVTLLAGSAAATGNKLGIMIAAWSCMMLASARPDLRGAAVGMALVQGVVLARSSPLDAAFVVPWAVIGSLATAGLVSAWTDFGSRADHDRLRAAELERAGPARLLTRQVAMLRQTTHAPRTSRRAADLEEIVKAAEAYLRPLRARGRLGAVLHAALDPVSDCGVRLDVDLGDLDADVSPACADAVAAVLSQIVSVLSRAARPGPVSIRAVGDTGGWQVTLLTDSPPASGVAGFDVPISDELLAGLRHAGVAQTSRAVPGGGLRVQLCPASPGQWQEAAMDPTRAAQG